MTLLDSDKCHKIFSLSLDVFKDTYANMLGFEYIVLENSRATTNFITKGL